ncbi:MAG: HAMP domain-containing sensor histidine kinase [Geobacteraceae bacterium]
MNWLKKLFHPFVTFIAIQVVWILLVVFWVYWYVGQHKEIRKIAGKYRPELLGQGFDWLVLVEGLALLLVILAGVYVIFLYWRRQSKLYREQQDAISQVTHELKSPLASIQLHLETIRLRKPTPDKLESFLDTMLADTERLNNLISNLLMAARIDQRRLDAHFSVIDFSVLLSDYMEQKRLKLPEGGSLKVMVDSDVRLAANVEGLQTVMRNLFENAVLYSVGAPDISVSLTKNDNHCFLTFEDRGMGIERKDLKRVFRMFYRIRRPGETIHGTGLGLYIVKSIVTEHGGKISVTSEGAGKGCKFIITLPQAK